MKKLPIYLRSILFLLATLFISTSSYANHILGMDLFYTWVSGNTYKITVVIYGDCGSSTAPAFAALNTASPRVCILRGNNPVNTISLNIEAPTAGVDISPVCLSQVGLTQCEDPNSTIPGIIKFVYSAIYTLPPPVVSNVWRFAFLGDLTNSQAGRSVNITNIVNPGPTLIQLVDTLDNSVYPNNSNAQFSVIPTPFFCLNKPDSYNPGAVSPVGDSLSVINLIPAMDAPPPGGPQCQFGGSVNYTGVAWNPPYTPISATTPLKVVANSYSYDATTGQLNFTPNALQRSTIVYNVREFRSGHFVGSCQREMNFLVQNCTSNPPTGGIAGVSNGIIVDSAHLTTCGNSGPFSFYFDPREPGTPNSITVTWSGVPAGAVINVTGNGTPTPHVTFSWNSIGVAPGNYIFYLTYTDNNCPLQGTNTTAISVTILPTPTLNYTIISPITCSPKEVINIIPGGTGSPWTVTVKGTTPHIFTGVTGSFIDSLSPGIDTISIKSSSGANRCDSSLIIVVPSAAISGDTTVCIGSKIILSDAMAGGSWSTANTSLATVIAAGTAMGTVTGVSGGIATITYTFPGGCFKTATVIVKPLPATITGDMHACTGLTTTLSDATSSGVWSSGTAAIATVGSVTGVVTGVAAGIAVISYTQNGCSITTTVTVNIQPSFNAGTANICTDGTATLVATPGGGTWSSTNTNIATITPVGADSAIVSGISIGTTIITYSLSGCTTSRTITAVSLLPPITGDTQVCTGQSIILSNAITGGTWTTGNTTLAIADAATGIVTGVSPGVPIITYSIGGSCVTSTSVTVNLSPDHGVITGLANLCVGYTISLSDTVSGGLWGMSNGSATISGAVVTGVFPGRDTVLYIVSNTMCTDTATKAITVYAVPDSGTISGPDALCVGHTITLSDSAPGGVWSSGSTVIATITPTGSRVVTGVSSGIDTIEYITGNPGCTTKTSYAITVYDPPVPGIIYGPPVVCKGVIFVMSDTASSGVWSSSNTLVATIGNTDSMYAVNQGATTIKYTIGPNLGGCYGVATFTVTVKPLLTINSTVSQVTCYGDNNGSISITINGGTPPLHYLYLWSNGSTDSVITGLAPGYDTLHVTEPSTLCKVSDIIQITQPDSLHVSAEATQDKCKTSNGTITTTVTGGTLPYTYQWSDNSTGSSLENLRAGTYTVTVTDHYDCTQTLSVEVTDNVCIIVVHDVITPNGDGINDTWIIEGIDNYTTNTVQIFDKWGDMVYEKMNYNNDWSGKGKGGNLLPDGTYYYLVKLNSINLLGGQNTFTGSILIKR